MDDQGYFLESVKIIKDWAIWVTGIQTGAIGILGVLLKDGVPRVPRRWALAALTFFVLSILSGVWLVERLPIVLGAIVEHGERIQAYEMSIREEHLLRLGTVARVMHWLFVLGITCFAAFVYSRTAPGKQPGG